jgi:uncharacterized repeat protein (TIGR03803 family)
MKRIVGELGKLSWAKRACVVFMLSAMTEIALPAQTFTSLFSFDGTDGQSPSAELVQATNGDLYGTTTTGGTNGGGTIFKIAPGGTLTTLYNFCSQTNCTDGQSPYAGLVQATNGYLYGTTTAGGDNGDGTIFQMNPGGTLTTLYNFCSQTNCADGEVPFAGLVQATNGDLYGTTIAGGANGGGTIFQMTLGGTLTTLYNFCSQTNCADGEGPHAGLVQATNGDLYGTTGKGGANNQGTIFKITPGGTLTTLYRFCQNLNCAYGTAIQSGLVQAADGYLYGTTLEGGATGMSPGGSVFRITPSGTLTTLHSFSCNLENCTDGHNPVGGLVQATNSDLYGTTEDGFGPTNYGAVFQMTPGGTLTALYNFCSQTNCADGEDPHAGLVQATNGDLYGTTSYGGSSSACGQAGCGTVFSLSLGLGPFVKTVPAAGVVGESVRILGYELTGATGVTFNGVAAAFTVVSSTEIIAGVPSGAITGPVQVVTPSGTLSSNVPFRVLP